MRVIPDVELKIKVTLNVNGKWAASLTPEELDEYIKARLNSSLGFRGQVKKIKVVR